ncbi:metallophosphoesterase [Nannocystis sp.]|uniref:metallophosphoesterase family protein n=1 Tax=Nannocystis sp. TaxID=1962667 RepID=UPI0025D08558|nr:metallophosphoesterase [Nannocystis sp.]MBK7824133.1 metallophosphoesterase [Nannocystis sp.]
MRRIAALLVSLAACPDGQVAGEATQGPGSGGEASTLASSETGSPTGTGGGTSGPGDTGVEPPPPGSVRFAVIGDFGLDIQPTRDVAAMVRGWAPDFVATVGDNNYFTGSADTIDVNIGKHYHAFIAPYRGSYGAGAAENRFFPCPGNHDWDGGSLEPYFDYFELPGNERYYRVRRGPVELFSLDSDPREPEGVAPGTTQGLWLEAALADSDASFKVVLMHHPPRSSGYHRDAVWMQWPFAAWGADLLLTGHDHDYERIVADGVPQIVLGTGGAALRPFTIETVGSQRGHADTYGALRITADETRMVIDEVAPGGLLVDRLQLFAGAPTEWSTVIAAGASWRYHERDAGPGWNALEFADADWPEGAAPLGYGAGGEGTTLPGGASPVKPMTTYLRHRFSVGDGSFAEGDPLRLRLAVDDGAVVYLNGVEVYRINLPEGPIVAATRAGLAVSNWFTPRMSETLIDGAALVVGENVLAVELHQHYAFSSDLRLDLELAAGVP